MSRLVIWAVVAAVIWSELGDRPRPRFLQPNASSVGALASHRWKRWVKVRRAEDRHEKVDDRNRERHRHQRARKPDRDRRGVTAPPAPRPGRAGRIATSWKYSPSQKEPVQREKDQRGEGT